LSFVPLPTISSQGSWGGKGTQKQAPKPFLIKKVAGIDPKSRADYGKAHVIISEKRDKKAAKYLVKDLPYPYTSKEQFERSLSTPLGTEWNTRVGFQRGTLPKVVMKVSLAPYPNALLQLLMLALLAGNDYQPIGEVGMIPHVVDTSSISFASALPPHDSLSVTLHECVDQEPSVALSDFHVALQHPSVKFHVQAQSCGAGQCVDGIWVMWIQCNNTVEQVREYPTRVQLLAPCCSPWS
jgi:hypothetical protein